MVSFEELSEREKQNIEIIRKFERMDENKKTIVWGPEKKGIWQDGYGVAAGWSDRFVIYDPSSANKAAPKAPQSSGASGINTLPASLFSSSLTTPVLWATPPDII